MVVTIIWLNFWSVLFVSLIALVCVAVLLVLCVCWDDKAFKNQNLKKFYIVDEDGFKSGDSSQVSSNSVSNLLNFRSLSQNFRSSVNNNELFSVQDLPLFKNSRDLESELLDSLDMSSRFNNTILRIEDDGECFSCISRESRDTFYSTVSPYAKPQIEECP